MGFFYNGNILLFDHFYNFCDIFTALSIFFQGAGTDMYGFDLFALQSGNLFFDSCICLWIAGTSIAFHKSGNLHLLTGIPLKASGALVKGLKAGGTGADGIGLQAGQYGDFFHGKRLLSLGDREGGFAAGSKETAGDPFGSGERNVTIGQPEMGLIKI